MDSVQGLREFVILRLTAAAEEIFSEFQKTIAQYEQELQRRQDVTWRAEIQVHSTDTSQQHDYKEQEVLADHLPSDLEKRSSLDQQGPEPPQIKEEETSRDKGEQLVLKEEIEAFTVTPVYEESGHIEPEPSRDPLLSQEAESRDQQQSNHVDSDGLTNDVDGFSSSQSSCNTDTGENHLTRGTTFEEKSQIQEHYRIHTAESPHLCTTCGKGFTQKWTLLSHMNTHMGEKPYSSKICRKSFTGPRPYSCQVCGKNFRQSYSLNTHMRIHTGEKPYSCKRCGKSFTQSNHLFVHVRNHSCEKLHTCVVCGKSFGKSNDLNSHMGTHTGEVVHGCEICGKGFQKSHNLSVHMRIHTGEKPFPCEICGKSFSQRSSLRSHVRIHTGEKPFPCEICGKSFTQSGSLNSHMRTHTGEKLQS